MSVMKKLILLTFLVGLVSMINTGVTQAYCVANDSGHTIYVADVAVPNKKSLDNGDIAPGEVACRPGNTLAIQIEKPLKRGVVSVNDKMTGNNIHCEVSPDGVVRYNGKNCYMKRRSYEFMNRAPNVYYNMN